MGTFKKISCLVFISIFLLLLGFSAFAEDLSLHFTFPVYLNMYEHNSSTGNWTSVGSISYDSFPSESGYVSPIFNPAYDMGYSSCSVPVADDNDIADVLHNGYSYVLTYFYRYTISIYDNAEVVDLPSDFQFSVSSDPNLISAGTNKLLIDDGLVYNYNVTSSSDVIESASNYVRYLVSVSYSFTVPPDDVLPIGQTYRYFNSLIYYYYDDLKATGSWSTSLRTYDFYGVYDPTGGTVDTPDEVDKIIEGQKEAAQYALEQEQQANQDAYDGAVDQDTSVFNLSDLVGSFTSLYTGLTYTGTDFNFKFPSSGVVPGFDMQLWQEQDIPLKYYIDQIPQPILIIIRAVFWIFVAICVIRMMYKVLGFINGHKGDDS